MDLNIQQFIANCLQASDELECVGKANFFSWCGYARFAEPQTKEEILEIFCHDCTHQYKSEMVRQGKCNLEKRKTNSWLS